MRVLVVSPHYDDAPLSLGQSLLDGELSQHTVTVGIVFGRSDYTRYFAPRRRRWPLATAIRAGEELRNARRFHYRVRFGGLEEVILRTGQGDSATFLSADFEPATSEVLTPVVELLTKWAGRYDQVIVPMGVGDHLDHRLVAEAGVLLGADAARAGASPKVAFYEDRPYASWIDDAAIAPLAERLDTVTRWSVPLERRAVSGPSTTRKQTTIWYPSQFHPSFIEAMAGDISGARVEHVWVAPSAAWPPRRSD